MLLRIASFSLFVLLNIDGAEAAENFSGGPFGGNSNGLEARGLVREDGIEVGIDFRWPEEFELEFELRPEVKLFVWVVARDTVLLVGFEASEPAVPCPEAVKVKVKYCSSSVAQTDTSICA